MLRPTFLSFETAKKALAISQLGLDTVGHNIANATTPGYTRQRVDQVSIGFSGGATKYQAFGVQFPGMGADLQGITQIRDPYLDNRYRAEAAVNGELGVKESGLSDINGIFDEIMTDGLHSKMGDLINALDVFAQSADSKELSMVVRNTANQLISILNKNASDLESARVQQKLDLNASVNEKVNTIIEKIANLNKKIKEENFYGNPANELNDERNLLIDNLSEYLDIKVTRSPVKISNDLTIYELGIELRDITTADGKPITLIDSGQFNKLKLTEEPENGNVKISVVDGVSGFDIYGDITNKLYKGAIKGYIDVINGAGASAPAGTSTFKGIPFYQASLDEFAQKLATVFNKVNNISAEEAARSGDPPLLSATYEKNLFGPLIPTLKPASSTESVPSWMESVASGTLGFSNSTYSFQFTTNHPTSPDKITAKMTGSDGVEREYTAKYEKNSVIEFIGADGTVAFTVSTTDKVPAQNSAAVVDASITARNISLTPNWLEDPLYITTTKFNPVTQAKPSIFLVGSTPAWLDSVELGGDDVTVKDASYEFKIDTTNHLLKVAIPTGSDTYYTYQLDNDNKLPKNSTLKLTRTDADGNEIVGLIIKTTDKGFGETSVENTASIRNSNGAANDNILKFKEAIKSSNGYSVSGYSGSFEEFLEDFQVEMASDLDYTTSLLDASTLVIAGFADRRDAVSAVSIDEEGINMMTYQNFYNAAARYMTALDEALDKIINGMGVVGR